MTARPNVTLTLRAETPHDFRVLLEQLALAAVERGFLTLDGLAASDILRLYDRCHRLPEETPTVTNSVTSG